jgi:cytochrome c-type biogenesis protein
VNTSIFFGGSIVAAFIAGGVALFAPCCISAMLPSFLASSAPNRRARVATTFLFAAGISSVIVPIALGAAALRRVMISEHAPIYVSAGVLLLVLAGYTLFGGRLRLPVPGRRATGRTGPLSIYSLGVFAGVTSSCCAPVLAGVVALSGVASSFVLSLGLAIAYVFGMVAPLFVLALMCDRYDWRSRRIFRPRTITWHIGPLRRTVTGSGLLSAVLLGAMGAFTLAVGLTGSAMPTPSGFQARLSARLAHWGHVVTSALDLIPSWAAALTFAIALALLARRALRELGWRGHSSDMSDPLETDQEDLVESRT